MQLTACCNTNVPFLLRITSFIALIEVSNASRPSSLFIVVVVTTYVGGAIKFICKKSKMDFVKCDGPVSSPQSKNVLFQVIWSTRTTATFTFDYK